MKHWLSIGLLAAAACASASAQPKIDAASGVVVGQAGARARKCAPELMAMADTALAEARRLEAAGDAEAAAAKAGQAEELARRAIAQSPEGCDEAKTDPETEDASRKLEPGVGSGAESVTLGDLEEALPIVYFDYNASVIREDSRAALSRVAELLVALPGTELEIEGHCDVRGSTEYNLHLGEQRARAVVKYLVAQGVAAERLSFISYGEENPLALGTSESDHAKNRRAQLNLR